MELTVRGDVEFTVSADGKVDFSKLQAWLSPNMRAIDFKSRYDADCDLSCLYFEVR